MANKEALRELQQRLADRMLQVKSVANSAAWLAVEVAGQGFLLPLVDSGEIFSLAAPTPVPHTAAWYRGVVSLRGNLYGVIDLGVFLGLKPVHHPLPLNDDQARLVTINAALNVNSAVLVDRLAGLRRADQLTLEAGPAPETQPLFAGNQYRDESQRLWQELRLHQLIRNEHFLRIEA